MKMMSVKMALGAIFSLAVLVGAWVPCFADGFTTSAVQTPEPLTLVMLGAGVVALVSLKKFYR